MVPNRTKMKWLEYLLVFFLFCLGIVVGIAIRHYNNIPINETINIIDVASLITTIFIAVYIPSILDRNLQINNDKKNVINERIDEIQAFYRRINSIVQQREISEKEYITLNNLLDIISHRWDTITILIGYFKTKNNFRKDIDIISKLNKEHHSLLISKSESELHSIDTQQKEEELYNKIDKATSLLLFKLSDA